MDTFDKANNIREALPPSEGVQVTGDGRLLVDMGFPTDEVEFDVARLANAPDTVLRDVLRLIYATGKHVGARDQRFDTIKRLGLD